MKIHTANLLKQTLEQTNSTFTEQEISKLSELMQYRRYKRGELVLRQGETSRSLLLVVDGLLRSFHTSTSGDERTVAFALSHHWAGDLDSFLHQKPSLLSIEALTETVVLSLPHAVSRELLGHDHTFDRFILHLLQESFTHNQRRLIQQQSHTAEELYWVFLDEYPELSRILTNKQIASYLGVSNECISRIRRRGTN